MLSPDGEFMMRSETEREIRKFIEDSFVFREDRGGLSAEESLLDAGLIDSTGILELVAFLESAFGIAIADAEIVPDNLDSIQAITCYVQRKLATETRAA